jgi:hypothetical protein
MGYGTARGCLMNDNTRPQWLVDIQNRSWEPEILISGITLTSLFLLSNHVYNVYGMLIQDHDVTQIQMHILFGMSTVMLTGLKLVLIAHLILRGLWTGLVGLSYVYPEGMRKERLSPQNRALDFPSPSELVIQVERVCSVLFAFIFASFSFFIILYIIYIPAVLLRFLVYDRTLYLYSNAFYFAVLIPLFALIVDKKFKTSKLSRILRTHLLKNMYLVFLTNIGRLRAFLIFLAYFMIILGICMSDILEFGFVNKFPDDSDKNAIVHIDENEYESSRNEKQRIERCTLHDFHVDGISATLFVSYYRADDYTLKKLSDRSAPIEKLYPHASISGIRLPALYRIQIDTTIIMNARWYGTRKIETGQRGYLATIDIGSFTDGFHELRVDKIVWLRGRKEPKLVENWARIPFEKRRSS